MNIKEAAIATNISPKDINQLIAHGRIPRPSRTNDGWEFSDVDIRTLKSVPRDMLPSVQRRYRRDAFWRNALSGVSISGSAITLARSAVENPSLEEAHTKEIMDSYAGEFVLWYKSIDPGDMSREEKKVFDRINEACIGLIELHEAMNLVSRKELINTRQLALVCNTSVNIIRKLWNERRISPRTQNYAGHLVWDSDSGNIDAIKKHISGEKILPVQRIQARRDILHFSIIDSDDNDDSSLQSRITEHFQDFGKPGGPEESLFDFVSSKLKQLGVIGGYYYPTEEDFDRINTIVGTHNEQRGFDFDKLVEAVTGWL